MSDVDGLTPDTPSAGSGGNDAAATMFYTVHPATGPSCNKAVDAVVLIHGWACDHTDWDALVDGLTAISQVIVVDLPGHGSSRSNPSGHTVGAMALPILAVMEFLGLRRVVLIGHSAGAEVAAMVAVRYPGRVRAVVSVDPAYGYPEDQRGAIERVSEKLNSDGTAEVVREYFAHLDDNPATPDWIAKMHEKSARACRPKVVREMFHSFAFGQDAIHFAPATAAFLRGRDWPLLGIYRNGDRGSIGRQFMTTPGDRVHVYEGAGHWPHQEQPDRFVADVTSWLLSLP